MHRFRGRGLCQQMWFSIWVLCRKREAALIETYLIQVVEKLLSELSLFDYCGQVQLLLSLYFSFDLDVPLVWTFPFFKILVFSQFWILLDICWIFWNLKKFVSILDKVFKGIECIIQHILLTHFFIMVEIFFHFWILAKCHKFGDLLRAFLDQGLYELLNS